MKEKCSVIYSADNEFQVLNVIYGHDLSWMVANKIAEMLDCIEHYDVVYFESLAKANEWILQQVKESRKCLTK